MNRKSISILTVATLTVAALGFGSSALAVTPDTAPPLFMASGFQFARFVAQKDGRVTVSGQQPTRWIRGTSKWNDTLGSDREFSVVVNPHEQDCSASARSTVTTDGRPEAWVTHQSGDRLEIRVARAAETQPVVLTCHRENHHA